MAITASPSQPSPHRTVEIDGIDIHFDASLRGDQDLVLVMVHGFGACLESWHDIYPALAAEFSVVRLDLKGSGFSSKPREPTYAPLDQAKILSAFLRELGLKKVVLIGHSLGGGVSLLAYLRNLDMPAGLSIDGLVLIDSVGYPQSPPFFIRVLRNPVTRFFSGLLSAEHRVRLVLNRAFEVKSRITPDRVERYAFFLRLPGAEFALARTAERVFPPDLDAITARFGEISCPALVIWGEKDRIIRPENAQRFCADLGNAQLLTLADTGHVPHEERPPPVVDAIGRFVRALVGRLRNP
ncbi:alpha/beta hydrolase [soil metagenome]